MIKSKADRVALHILYDEQKGRDAPRRREASREAVGEIHSARKVEVVGIIGVAQTRRSAPTNVIIAILRRSGAKNVIAMLSRTVATALASACDGCCNGSWRIHF